MRLKSKTKILKGCQQQVGLGQGLYKRRWYNDALFIENQQKYEE